MAGSPLSVCAATAIAIDNNIFKQKAAGGSLNIRCILVLGGAPQTPYLCLADGISCAQAVDSNVRSSRFRFAALDKRCS